ncbi:hypothetical protein ACFX13_030189 [Malus domestica]
MGTPPQSSLSTNLERETLSEQLERLRLALASSFWNSMRDFCWAVRSVEAAEEESLLVVDESEWSALAVESDLKRLAEGTMAGGKRSNRALEYMPASLDNKDGCAGSICSRQWGATLMIRVHCYCNIP